MDFAVKTEAKAVSMTNGIPLRGAILHGTTLFIPGKRLSDKDPRAINLPQNIQVDGLKEKGLELKMTMNEAGTFVEVVTKDGSGFVPISAFQCIVPA